MKGEQRERQETLRTLAWKMRETRKEVPGRLGVEYAYSQAAEALGLGMVTWDEYLELLREAGL